LCFHFVVFFGSFGCLSCPAFSFYFVGGFCCFLGFLFLFLFNPVLFSSFYAPILFSSFLHSFCVCSLAVVCLPVQFFTHILLFYVFLFPSRFFGFMFLFCFLFLMFLFLFLRATDSIVIPMKAEVSMSLGTFVFNNLM
jgi:hypothetical protein